MSATRRSVLFAVALGFGALVGPAVSIGVAQAAPAQNFGVTTSTTVPGATTAPSTTQAADTSSGGGSSDRPLFTESRKIVAIIGGLVVVAIALTLLTVRYWRTTKPTFPHIADPSLDVDNLSSYERAVIGARLQAAMQEPKAPAEVRDLPPPEDLAVLKGTTVEEGLAAKPTPSPAARSEDHLSADDDWSPRGTGEHDRIDVGERTAGRPGAAARRRALGLPTEG